MRKIKNGVIALLVYCMLAAAAYGVVTFWKWHPGFIYTIIFMLSVVVWYEALTRAFKRDMGRGMGVVLSYIIPSIVISYLNYSAGLAGAGKATINTTVYELFHMPMIFGLNVTSGLLVDHPLLMIFFPSLMMLILAIYPFARNISKAIEAQHTQYIFR
ncbi:hypothetical protein [Syntrophomonas curvata]